MKVLAIQHSPKEPMGYIEEVLEDLGVNYEYVKVYETNEVPVKFATHIIIMGGPMGAYEDDKYPFLSQEKDLIREALKSKIPILGVCLGAQLIASALNCKVYPYKRELGWFEVEKVEEDEVVRGLPNRMVVFQWHNDTFDLPNGAKLLYAGREVRNQAFRVGKAIGLQFHLEMTKELIKDWLEDEDLSEEEKRRIVEDCERFLKDLNENCRKLIENFLRL